MISFCTNSSTQTSADKTAILLVGSITVAFKKQTTTLAPGLLLARQCACTVIILVDRQCKTWGSQEEHVVRERPPLWHPEPRLTVSG